MKAEIIAITEDEQLRVRLDRGLYQLEKLHSWISGNWVVMKSTDTEWLASKWILHHDMKVGGDYPTIDEIRKSQRK